MDIGICPNGICPIDYRIKSVLSTIASNLSYRLSHQICPIDYRIKSVLSTIASNLSYRLSHQICPHAYAISPNPYSLAMLPLPSSYRKLQAKQMHTLCTRLNAEPRVQKECRKINGQQSGARGSEDWAE
jgi:hypothetical protein